MTQSPSHAILLELSSRGIELRAHGGQLRYRPKPAMTSELAERIAEHKSELLALALSVVPLPSGNAGEDRNTRDARPRARSEGNHNLAGLDIPDGWTPKGWTRNLERMAKACEVLNPTAAAAYRRRAEAIRRGHR